jgi:carboxyl-terminal processing protease
MDKAITGMLSSLDPYTVYFNEQEVNFKNKQYGRVYWHRRLDY